MMSGLGHQPSASAAASSVHIMQEVLPPGAEIGKPPWYICPLCFLALKEIEEMQSHVNTHPGYDNYLKRPGKKTFITTGKIPTLDLAERTRGRNLNIMPSRIHGNGVFTSSFIPKNELIIEYSGDTITKTEALKRQRRYDRLKVDNFFMRPHGTKSSVVIDATVKGNCSKFINNSCDPNCDAALAKFAGGSRLIIFALRDILAGEELTYDYEFTSDELVACNCGSHKCKKFLNKNIEDLQLKPDDAEILADSLTNG